MGNKRQKLPLSDGFKGMHHAPPIKEECEQRCLSRPAGKLASKY
jgi:hypothetical protein